VLSIRARNQFQARLGTFWRFDHEPPPRMRSEIQGGSLTAIGTPGEQSFHFRPIDLVRLEGCEKKLVIARDIALHCSLAERT